jgi:MscS family membrane protein
LNAGAGEGLLLSEALGVERARTARESDLSSKTTGKVRSAALAVLLGVLLCAGALPAAGAAQIPGFGGGAPAEEAEVPPGFESPRSLVELYLSQIVPYVAGGDGEGNLDVAASVFASSLGSPAVRRELAKDLLFALDRIREVNPERFPDAGAPALESGFFSRRVARADNPELGLELEFGRQEDGSWRIVGPTPDAASDLRKVMVLQGTPVIEGLGKDGALTMAEVLRTKVVPRSMQGAGFLLETWQWIGLLVLIVVCVVLDFLARAIARVIVVRWTRRAGAEAPREDTAKFVRPVGLFVAATVFQLALYLLDLTPSQYSVLSVAAGFIVTIAGVWAMYQLVDVFTGHLAEKAKHTHNKFDDMLVPLLRRTLKLVVVAIGLLYLASLWTEDLWSIVAGLGIGSIAVGFAAKDSIENLFGTFTVLMDKPFTLGDWITMADVDGSVEEVGFRSTRIRTFYNSVITVPNSKFVSTPVDNMGARRYRRIRETLGVTYDTPAEKVEAFCEGIRELIRHHPYTRKDYYHVYFNGFGDSSLEVMLYCFVETPEWGTELREKHRLFADIMRLAERLKVSFAFPTQTIHLAKPEDLEHPDRPADDVAGEELGREAATAVLEDSLGRFGDEVPAPVRFDVKSGERWRGGGE